MLSRKQPRRQEIRMVDIAVVGAGTMGAGIAESAALAGLSVVMVDVREEALDLGRNTIERDLKRRVKKGRLSEEERRASVGRVSTTTALEACEGAPVAIEAVVEEMAEQLGKTPIRVSDTPGFVVNRVARPFYLEALRLVEASGEPGPIDAAIRGAGFRMGPLQLADLIGNDVNLTVSESLFERYYYHPRFRPSYLQRSMVEGGLLGRKSGRGFYDYGAENTVEDNEIGLSEDVSLRVISCIVNEAFLALSEGVATAEDIDRAMKLGANYPKGPFEWVEEIGARSIVETLDSLRATNGDAYLAAPALRERATGTRPP